MVTPNEAPSFTTTNVKPMNRSLPCLRRRAARPQARVTATRAFAAATRRPPVAPKPIIDIKDIRQNPERYEATCRQRNYAARAQHPRSIIRLHTQWQDLQRQGRSLRQRANLVRKFLANPATGSGDEDMAAVRAMTRDEVRAEARRLKAQLSVIERGEAEAAAEMEALALALPNLTSEATPPGGEPRLLGYINEPPATATHRDEKADDTPSWRSHVHVGAELGVLDFAAAATASGWGWYYLVGEGAQLEQALIQYALAVATRHGWTHVSPPTVVYSHIGAACGFQPRGPRGEQVYTIAQSAADAERGVPERCLAGTSEISLAGMKADVTLDAADLPLKRVAVSRCYRAEAGARGADTRGLYRVHEFSKVELFAWTAPDAPACAALYDEMLDMQTEILQSLGLRCRVLEMPAGDLGASAARKVDMEAWFPSRRARGGGADGGWGEVTSASICTDYQTRRLATRLRANGALTFPWTCNGTALAVPRVMAALLEKGWDEDARTVAVPEVLRPWMDGKDVMGG